DIGHENLDKSLIKEGKPTHFSSRPGRVPMCGQKNRANPDCSEMGEAVTLSRGVTQIVCWPYPMQVSKSSLQARLLQLHPHELPEVIAVETDFGHADHQPWVAAQTPRKD
ncbi:MAG: hypothetical protein ABIW30_05020, partial [Arenimonas sp.]